MSDTHPNNPNLRAPWKKGDPSPNPGGKPKTEPLFRARCRKFVDEHVVKAWQDEVTTRGEKWLEASKLLAAYGYGIPKDAPTDADGTVDTVPTPEEAAAAAARLRALRESH